METILIAGANGKTGREIVNILQDHPSYEPVAMVRNEEQKAYFENQNVKVELGDLEGNLTEVVKGKDRVIFAAGSGGNTGKEKTTAVDQEGAINLIDRAKAAGVKKLVMLSSMGADNPSQNEDLQHYLEAKQTADNHLKASFLDYSIVRPGALTDGEKTNRIKAKEKLNEYGEISRKDVAQVMVDCLSPNTLQNKTFEILKGSLATELALQEV
ncbi:SDR family oxidoreductase [Mesonia aestuariivivens]|uniref:SDR family oxidoreductase n=1 Tax=Mesonia aestuariivivens TaxID=2796128 RepID=A0ABS6VXK2_9FLAO|nr:SDR family oxidoreductase [Mesonia aestuariivivens]MBW2960315.1 SDR family oxidoreductase [Mesonia aestuariivivens]